MRFREIDADPDPKSSTARAKAIAAISILVVVGVTAAVIGAKTHQLPPGSSNVGMPAAHSPSRTTTPTPVAVTAQKPLMLESSAPANDRELFTIGPGPDWDVAWSYDCSKSPSDLFLVSVYDAAGHASRATPPIVQSGVSGSGVQHYHQSGTHFLGVRSKSTCHIEVQAPAPT